MDYTVAHTNLYKFITYGRTPAEALRMLEARPSRVRADLHAPYGRYGSNWAYNDDMPSFELALEMLHGEIAQRLRDET